MISWSDVLITRSQLTVASSSSPSSPPNFIVGEIVLLLYLAAGTLFFGYVHENISSWLRFLNKAYALHDFCWEIRFIKSVSHLNLLAVFVVRWSCVISIREPLPC